MSADFTSTSQNHETRLSQREMTSIGFLQCMFIHGDYHKTGQQLWLWFIITSKSCVCVMCVHGLGEMITHLLPRRSSSCFVLSTTCELTANTHLILLDSETWHQFVPVGEGPEAKFPNPHASLFPGQNVHLSVFSPLKTSGWEPSKDTLSSSFTTTKVYLRLNTTLLVRGKQKALVVAGSFPLISIHLLWEHLCHTVTVNENILIAWC